MRMMLAALCAILPTVAYANAKVIEGAAYLPDDLMSMMPKLQEAIALVAAHPDCIVIENASFSDTYGRTTEPAFFVTCTTAGFFGFHNVFVKDGRIIGTGPWL